MTSGLTITNEPKRIACGAPDYIVTRKEVPVGYVEAKDIDVDLNSNANKAQLDRYKQSLNNLIITDYLTFQLFLNRLIADYKKNLNEQKLNLDDDYIKFIRYGQYFIEKNGEGILAYISNNSFIDGITHRQMRNALLTTFDKIYILDLHGNRKKKETTPDGNKDENVFDIMQGVSINIFVKTRKESSSHSGFDPQSLKNKPFAAVYHFDLYGKRSEKYSFLLNNNLQTVNWQLIENKSPYFFFVPKSEDYKDEYDKGFYIKDLFLIHNSGIKTDRDSLFIDNDRKTLVKRIKILLSQEFDDDFKQKFRVKNSSSYKLTEAIKGKEFEDTFIQQIEYRPFDRKGIYYSPELISRPAYKVMHHFVNFENVGLVASRQFGGHKHFICFITNKPIEISSQPYAPYSVFPLYVYVKNGVADNDSRPYHKRHNLSTVIINEISKRLGMLFNEDVGEDLRVCPDTCWGTQTGVSQHEKFTPVDILDYMYAVLHCLAYREKYKEFLKIDFPRVPYPENAKQFWKLVALGGKLRRLHLMEDIDIQEKMANFPLTGNNEIEKIEYHPLSPPAGTRGRVYINDTQYFDNVPLIAWNFYIGGYQPAQKWLKDRKGQILNFEDIQHYQKIIWVLCETENVMKEVNKLMK